MEDHTSHCLKGLCKAPTELHHIWVPLYFLPQCVDFELLQEAKEQLPESPTKILSNLIFRAQSFIGPLEEGTGILK